MSAGIIALFAALNTRSLASMAFSSAGFALLILVPSALLAAAVADTLAERRARRAASV
jgi:hypothetical protein